jgi:hypothetical protein
VDGWVIDGGYWRKIGDLVLSRADVVVWIDLPIHVWLPRLVRRTVRRLRGDEEIWNGNRETVRGAVWGREALFPYARRTHFSRRRSDPPRLMPYPVVRLRSQSAVDASLSGVAP